jgi:hypothetical protein
MWIVIIDSWRMGSRLQPSGISLLFNLQLRFPALRHVSAVTDIANRFIWTGDLNKSVHMYWDDLISPVWWVRPLPICTKVEKEGPFVDDRRLRQESTYVFLCSIVIARPVRHQVSKEGLLQSSTPCGGVASPLGCQLHLSGTGIVLKRGSLRIPIPTDGWSTV